MARREGMTLPDGDELGPESEADDGDVQLAFAHGVKRVKPTPWNLRDAAKGDRGKP
jgi:hypothetical protein